MPSTSATTSVLRAGPVPAAGALIREARLAAGLTGVQLAQRVGVARSLVSRWEHGDRAFNGCAAERCCVLLGLDPAALGVEPRPSRVAVPGLSGARRRCGISQIQLAALVGVHVDTLGGWERDLIRPETSRLPTLCQVLGVRNTHTLTHDQPATWARWTGDPLRRARQRAGVTQTEAADLLGVNIRTLAGFERGRRRPTYADVRTMAAIYGLDLPVLARALELPAPALLTRRRGVPGSADAVLAQLRSWHGMSREQLATVAGVTSQTFGRWEVGDRRPSVDGCRRLERAFGLSPGALEGSR